MDRRAEDVAPGAAAQQAGRPRGFLSPSTCGTGSGPGWLSVSCAGGSGLGHSKTGTPCEPQHDLKGASLERPRQKQGALLEAGPESVHTSRSAPTTLSWPPSALTCPSPPPPCTLRPRHTPCSCLQEGAGSVRGRAGGPAECARVPARLLRDPRNSG